MKKLLLLLLLASPSVTLFAQDDVDTSWKKNYRESAPKINDLVHTKLDASFDYNKSQLLGKVWITLKPHFYPTDTLSLDAKGMDIKKVALTSGSKQTDLKYAYDGYFLNIKLPKVYKSSEEYTIYIDYVAK